MVNQGRPMPTINPKINITIRDKYNHNASFDSLKALTLFLEKEAKYWLSIQEKVIEKGTLHSCVKYASRFSSALTDIKNYGGTENWGENEWQRSISNTINNHLGQSSNQWLWSGHDYVPKFVDIYLEKSAEVADSFVNYMNVNSIGNFGQKSSFEGAILAYEYTYQNSDLAKRRKSERASLTKLRNELSEANDQLIQEVEEEKQAFFDWLQKTKQAETERCEKQVSYSSRLNEATKWKAKKKTERYQSDFDKSMTEWKDEIANLEKTYEEKLRLSKPAEYWSKSAQKYGRQGGIYSLLIVLFVSAALFYLADLFAIWQLKNNEALTIASLKPMVVFATLGAIFAFVIRVFARMAFSSFHLMRDAEEREQLTYLYLSLSKESEIDKESRDIVLQALFSRSETGLLNQDSGPSMPSGTEALKIALKRTQ